jgi:hypothetical protein
MHSKGSYNKIKISKIDSKGEKEVSKDIVDGLVYNNRMWIIVVGRGSRNSLIIGRSSYVK